MKFTSRAAWAARPWPKRWTDGFVTFEEFMPSIGDGMMDTGDLIPKIQAMSRK